MCWCTPSKFKQLAPWKMLFLKGKRLPSMNFVEGLSLLNFRGVCWCDVAGVLLKVWVFWGVASCGCQSHVAVCQWQSVCQGRCLKTSSQMGFYRLYKERSITTIYKPSLKLKPKQLAPENRPKPQMKKKSPNHQFSGASFLCFQGGLDGSPFSLAPVTTKNRSLLAKSLKLHLPRGGESSL